MSKSVGESRTLDGMIGCVAADMGVTLLPRAVVERSAMNGSITIHALSPAHARVETVFIHRSAGHQTSALSGFADCLKKDEAVIADAAAQNQVIAPAKTAEDMQRVIANNYVDATLCGLFMLVVVVTLVLGLRAALAARRNDRPSAQETPYVALGSMQP